MTAEEYLEDMDKSSNDINDIIEEAMIGYARIKCKELLEVVAEKARVIERTPYINYEPEEMVIIGSNMISIDKDSIFNAVDLESFCS